MSRRHSSLIPLSHQHQHALALALILRRRVGIEKGEAAWSEEMADKVKKIYATELTGHFEVEESILFPSMERYLGSLELVGVLRQEHQSLRDLAVRVGEGFPTSPGQAAVPQEPKELPDLLGEFSRTLESHVRKEERELFVEFEKRMPADEAIKVGREIEARLARVCPNL